MIRRPTAGWLALLWALFIVYGSLVPLDFKPLPLDEAWTRFQRIPFLHLGLESRADWVANGVLYAPLGLLLASAAAAWRWPAALALPLMTAACCVLAVGVEFSQLWFPQRTVSLNDIWAECIGSLLGVMVAPLLAGWIGRLGQGWRSGGERLLPRLLELYAVAYVLLCFFPYDFLLSGAELQGKLASGNWGWLFAHSDRGAFFVGLQWWVEVALALPLGALRGLHPPGRPTARGRALALGLALGLLIEGGQFLVNSGISQGASVLSRGVGVGLGAVAWPCVRRLGWGGLRGALRPWVIWAALGYLPLLAAVNGAFRLAWQGPAGAWASLQTTHWLPFYYHYFTTEALALFSLGSVVLMYSPVLLLCWLRGLGAGWTALLTGALAGVVETGKLFLPVTHADPTNIAVAVVGNTVLGALLALAQRAAPAPGRPTPAAAVAVPAARVDIAPAGIGKLPLAVLPVVALAAAAFPTAPALLLAGLALLGGLVWRWPVLALGLIPAALPVFDLAPWSGRFFLDEFDLLQAVCLAVAFSRLPVPRGRQPRLPGALLLAWAALALSLVLSGWRGLWPLDVPLDNAWNSYYSPWNALRILKGAAWAGLFAALWTRLADAPGRRAETLGAGVMGGLALTLAFVFWERLTFASLWDFAADFRITGPFSAMHKGGAYIECYLAVAAAFAGAAALQPGPVWRRAGAALLLLGAVYATMVTYSRNGYAALALVLLATLAAAAGAWWRRPAAGWSGPVAALLTVLAVAAAVPIAGGPYARQRLAQSGQDLAVRQAHWADGLALRDRDLLTDVLGMGIGRFPQAHYWHSAEALHAGGYSLQRDGSRRVLRLAQGAPLYLEQIIPRPDIAVLKLSLDYRDTAGAPPRVALCEKWTLSSVGCAQVMGSTTRAGTAGWQHVEWTLDVSRQLARAAPWRAPLKLSLVTPTEGTLDLTQVALLSALGDPLLVNGDFTQGLDHWYFATDVDPPWHLHSLPVAVLFDQGWFGVLAWGLVLSLALAGGVRALWQGRALVPAALPALLGFLASGLLNTLIDAPRFLAMLLLLAWLAPQRQPLSRVGPMPGDVTPAP